MTTLVSQIFCLRVARVHCDRDEIGQAVESEWKTDRPMIIVPAAAEPNFAFSSDEGGISTSSLAAHRQGVGYVCYSRMTEGGFWVAWMEEAREEA